MNSDRLRFLIVEGNPQSARNRLEAQGVVYGAAHYAKVIREISTDPFIDIVYPADTDAGLPRGASLRDYDGIVLTGSALHVYDDVPEVRRQIDLVREAFHSCTPVFGSCWGTQVAVVAAGGSVRKSPNGIEAGIGRKIQVTSDGAGHPMYAGKPAVFDSFAAHFDEVETVPDGATVLASNAHSPIQAVAFKPNGGSYWGVQYHPEFDFQIVAALCRAYGDDLVKLGFFGSREAAFASSATLDSLHADPKRSDLAWQVGVDKDILDPDCRRLEIRNWIERMVRPQA